MDIDHFQDMLEELCEEIPPEFYENLHQGVVLLEDIKYHRESYHGDLVVLGEYIQSKWGSQIRIYYGSFMERFKTFSDEELKEEVRSTLIHEFRHHVEFLCGNRDLEIEDELFLEQYRKERGF